MKIETVLSGVATVQIRGDVFEVKELRWRDYLWVVQRVTSTAFELFGGAKVNATELTLDKDKLLKAIAEQEEVFVWLMKKATSIPEDKIQDLSATEAMLFLDKIVELNLRPELAEAGKALAGRMGSVFQVKAPLPAPSTALSSPATRSATSTK